MTTLFDTTLDAKFAEYHAAHPEVYRHFRKFAFELWNAGRRRGSAQQIIERIRWETSVNPNRDGGLKINNWFRTHYAKMLVENEPVFDGFFEFRSRG